MEAIAVFVIKFGEILLRSPTIRSFLEGIALKFMSKIWFHPAADDDFKQSFDGLMKQLAVTTDPKEEQRILAEIQRLRSK